MAYYPEIENLTLEELVTHFYGPPIEADESPSIYYTEVALQIRRKGNQGSEFLWKAFDPSLDEDHLEAVMCALTYPIELDPRIAPLKDEIQIALHEKLPMLLQDNRPSICAEAIDSLISLGEKSVLDTILELYRSPSPYVRGAVLRYVARLHPEIAKEYLLESLRDPHSAVRDNAIDELDMLDAVEAIPYIRELLTDENPDVRQAAESAIKSLTDSLE